MQKKDQRHGTDVGFQSALSAHEDTVEEIIEILLHRHEQQFVHAHGDTTTHEISFLLHHVEDILPRTGIMLLGFLQSILPYLQVIALAIDGQRQRLAFLVEGKEESPCVVAVVAEGEPATG